MVATRKWIEDFLGEHMERFGCGPPDWPEPGTEAWDVLVRDWVRAFNPKEVTEAEASEASSLLAANPPKWRTDHLPMVLATVETMRREKKGSGVESDRQAAQDHSRDCPHCSGNGIAVVFNPCPGQNPKVPDHASALCVCPYGRWLKRYYGNRDNGAMLRRFVDLADVHNRRSGWCATPPGDEAFAGVTDDDDLAF